ncbi:MAG: MFS transporter [Bacteroidales bacterium]|nr:MFS transporter [Bacteroidales bacterium]
MKEQRPLLIAILISSVLGPFLSSAMNVALPQISDDLNMNATELSWVNMSFLLASAAFMIPLGKIADRVGRKAIFILGNIIVLITAIFCVTVSDSFVFLSLRFIQGIGSSMMFVTSMAIITSAFPKEQRGKYIGFAVTAVYLGLSAAPFLGGIFITIFDWKSLFIITIINSVIVILLMMLHKGKDWKEERKMRFDITGSVVFVIFMTLFMYGFAHLIDDTLSQILCGTGAAGLVLFVVIEFQQKNPVFDVRFFASNRVFAFSNLAALINYACTFAVAFLLSLYLQKSRGLNPKDTGLILVIQPIIMAIVANIAGRLSDKYSQRLLASMGMMLSAIGIALLFFVQIDSSFTLIYVALFVLGIGFGLFSTPNTHAVMNAVEPKQFGMASASISTMRISGQMISMGLAALFINWLLGSAKIEPHNSILIVDVMHYVFGIFFVLSIWGIYLSMARDKKKALA